MKGNEVATSSNRQDYKPYGPEVKPDTAVRRNALSKSEVCVPFTLYFAIN